MTGEQLKMEILKRGHTIKAVAESVGQSPSNFGNKLGRDDVSSSLVEVVAAALGISPADFYQPAKGGDVQTDISEARRRERELLRTLSVAALQAQISSPAPVADGDLGGQTLERIVAQRSVRYAQAMLDEFKRHGIDK